MPIAGYILKNWRTIFNFISSLLAVIFYFWKKYYFIYYSVMNNNFNFSLFSVHTIILLLFKIQFSSEVILLLTSVQSHNKLTSTIQILLNQFPNQSSTYCWSYYVYLCYTYRNNIKNSWNSSSGWSVYFSFLVLILVFISFFANIFSTYLFIFKLKIISALISLTVNWNQ